MTDYSRIPEELRRLDQWVCNWNDSKIPMRATERRGASSVDPATWSSFDQAVGAVEAGEYDYIGFVFHDNGIVGIDIDAGFEDGLLSPLSADIISRCKSYTEYSKSGRGVHIFLKGMLPFPGKNNQAGVEIYCDRRYFVTTGQVLLFDQIIENQDAVDYVLDKYFKDAPRTKQEGPELKKGSIYTPAYQKPVKGSLRLSADYPEIQKGSRNLSMLSVAGRLWTQGYPLKQLYKELCRINQTACKPPLSERELQSICKSISKYER